MWLKKDAGYSRLDVSNIWAVADKRIYITRTCTLWRCKSTPTQRQCCSGWHQTSLWANRRQTHDKEPSQFSLFDPVPLTLTLTFWTQNQQASTECRGLYYCVKFQVIPIRSFRFIVLTLYTHIHTHTHRDSVIAISAPPYYVVGADSDNMNKEYRKIHTKRKRYFPGNGIRLKTAVEVHP